MALLGMGGESAASRELLAMMWSQPISLRAKGVREALGRSHTFRTHQALLWGQAHSLHCVLQTSQQHMLRDSQRQKHGCPEKGREFLFGIIQLVNDTAGPDRLPTPFSLPIPCNPVADLPTSDNKTQASQGQASSCSMAPGCQDAPWPLLPLLFMPACGCSSLRRT